MNITEQFLIDSASLDGYPEFENSVAFKNQKSNILTKVTASNSTRDQSEEENYIINSIEARTKSILSTVQDNSHCGREDKLTYNNIGYTPQSFGQPTDDADSSYASYETSFDDVDTKDCDTKTDNARHSEKERKEKVFS